MNKFINKNQYTCLACNERLHKKIKKIYKKINWFFFMINI